jgi:hypothetical protein
MANVIPCGASAARPNSTFVCRNATFGFCQFRANVLILSEICQTAAAARALSDCSVRTGSTGRG